MFKADADAAIGQGAGPFEPADQVGPGFVAVGQRQPGRDRVAIRFKGAAKLKGFALAFVGIGCDAELGVGGADRHVIGQADAGIGATLGFDHVEFFGLGLGVAKFDVQIGAFAKRVVKAREDGRGIGGGGAKILFLAVAIAHADAAGRDFGKAQDRRHVTAPFLGVDKVGIGDIGVVGLVVGQPEGKADARGPPDFKPSRQEQVAAGAGFVHSAKVVAKGAHVIGAEFGRKAKRRCRDFARVAEGKGRAAKVDLAAVIGVLCDDRACDIELQPVKRGFAADAEA